MIINEEKTMRLVLNYKTWKERKSVIYLGAMIGNARVAVKGILVKQETRMHSCIINCFQLMSEQYKLHVFKCIKAILIYGLKEIIFNYLLLRKLDFVLCELKSITGYKFDKKVSYGTKKTIENFNIKHNWPSEIIKKWRIKMYRYILRHDKTLILPEDWKCLRGRVPNSLFSLMCRDFKLHGTRQYRERDIYELAKDCDEWKRLST